MTLGATGSVRRVHTGLLDEEHGEGETFAWFIFIYIFIYILAHTFFLEVWVKTPLLFSDFIGKCVGKLLCIMNTRVRRYLTTKITGHSFFDPLSQS